MSEEIQKIQTSIRNNAYMYRSIVPILQELYGEALNIEKVQIVDDIEVVEFSVRVSGDVARMVEQFDEKNKRYSGYTRLKRLVKQLKKSFPEVCINQAVLYWAFRNGWLWNLTEDSLYFLAANYDVPQVKVFADYLSSRYSIRISSIQQYYELLSEFKGNVVVVKKFKTSWWITLMVEEGRQFKIQKLIHIVFDNKLSGEGKFAVEMAMMAVASALMRVMYFVGSESLAELVARVDSWIQATLDDGVSRYLSELANILTYMSLVRISKG